MSDWRGVDEFVSVVEHGSITRAADSLGLSKSYVSKVLDREWSYFDQPVWISFAPGILAASTRAFVDFITTRFAKVRDVYRRPASYRKLTALRDPYA